MFKIEDCTLPLLQIIIWFLACKNLNKAAYLWFCYRYFFIQLISNCCFNSLFKYFKEVHKAFPVYWRAKSLIDFIDSWWQILHFSGVAVRKAWGLNLSGGGGEGGVVVTFIVTMQTSYQIAFISNIINWRQLTLWSVKLSNA